MTIGIVGHEAAKFTPTTEAIARSIIRQILAQYPTADVVSGACHLGGIDVWAIEEAKADGRRTTEFPPKVRSWDAGFKPRNIRIAETSDVVHCIVVRQLPESYRGMRFPLCYHCHSADHVKSGGCWTARYAMKLGKTAHWHLI